MASKMSLQTEQEKKIVCVCGMLGVPDVFGTQWENDRKGKKFMLIEKERTEAKQ